MVPEAERFVERPTFWIIAGTTLLSSVGDPTAGCGYMWTGTLKPKLMGQTETCHIQTMACQEISVGRVMISHVPIVILISLLAPRSMMPAHSTLLIMGWSMRCACQALCVIVKINSAAPRNHFHRMPTPSLCTISMQDREMSLLIPLALLV